MDLQRPVKMEAINKARNQSGSVNCDTSDSKDK